MLYSNKLLIPFAPRTFELWSGKIIAEIVTECKKMNDPLQVYSVLNLAYSSGDDNQQTTEIIRDEWPVLHMLSCSIVQRKAWSNSSGHGFAIYEKKFRDNKAVAEFWNMLSGLGFTKAQITKGLA